MRNPGLMAAETDREALIERFPWDPVARSAMLICSRVWRVPTTQLQDERCRLQPVATVRMAAMGLLSGLESFSLHAVGTAFSRHHASALYAQRFVRDQREVCPDFAERYQEAARDFQKVLASRRPTVGLGQGYVVGYCAVHGQQSAVDIMTGGYIRLHCGCDLYRSDDDTWVRKQQMEVAA